MPTRFGLVTSTVTTLSELQPQQLVLLPLSCHTTLTTTKRAASMDWTKTIFCVLTTATLSSTRQSQSPPEEWPLTQEYSFISGSNSRTELTTAEQTTKSATQWTSLFWITRRVSTVKTMGSYLQALSPSLYRPPWFWLQLVSSESTYQERIIITARITKHDGEWLWPRRTIVPAVWLVFICFKLLYCVCMNFSYHLIPDTFWSIPPVTFSELLTTLGKFMGFKLSL